MIEDFFGREKPTRAAAPLISAESLRRKLENYNRRQQEAENHYLNETFICPVCKHKTKVFDANIYARQGKFIREYETKERATYKTTIITKHKIYDKDFFRVCKSCSSKFEKKRDRASVKSIVISLLIVLLVLLYFGIVLKQWISGIIISCIVAVPLLAFFIKIICPDPDFPYISLDKAKEYNALHSALDVRGQFKE